MHQPSAQPSLLKVTMAPEAPCLFVTVSGELDLCSVNEVPRDAYASRPDLTTVLVDLGGLAFCDLTGLRALLAFARHQQAQGRAVQVVRATPSVRRLMLMCGVTNHLECAHLAGAPAV